jgi:hypothetical protein
MNVHLGLIRIITNWLHWFSYFYSRNFDIEIQHLRFSVLFCGPFWQHKPEWATLRGRNSSRGDAWQGSLLRAVYCLSVQGVSLSHRLCMVQFEVTNKARAGALAHLLQIEMTRAEDAASTRTSGSETRVLDVVGIRRVCNALFLEIQLTVH